MSVYRKSETTAEEGSTGVLGIKGRRMRPAGLTKVETFFVLITKGSMGRGDHFREETGRNERKDHTKNCHHTDLFSRADTTPMTLDRNRWELPIMSTTRPGWMKLRH